MTKQHELRDRSVIFVECRDEECPRALARGHMHCPCGCPCITTMNPPVAWTCENCSNSCFSVSYDRGSSLFLCYKDQRIAWAARAAAKRVSS